MAKTKDEYSNIYSVSLTLSAANTISFSEINLGIGLFDNYGIIIQRLEYDIASAALQEMTADGDRFELAIVTSNQIDNMPVSEAAVLHKMQIRRADFGTAGSAQLVYSPFQVDFTNLPGGGLITVPKPLYFAAVTSGLASAATVALRMFFTVLQLQPTQYLELLESRRFLA